MEFVLEVADHRRREHLAEEEHHQPRRALLHQLGHRRIHVGLLQCPHAADLLDVLGRRLLLHVEHVVHRHDAEELLVAVGDRQGVAVVSLESLHRHLRRIGRL